MEREFEDGACNCRFIITTPEHARKDCPHYTWSEEKSFLRSALIRVREETLKEAMRLTEGMKGSKKHLCPFNDGECTCNCYTAALSDVKEKLGRMSGGKAA